MFGFKQYIPFLSEQKTPARGIQHLPHPAESAFNVKKSAVGGALSKLQSVISGRAPITKKIDDKMSFQVIKDDKGRVGVKYKGPGAKYNFSHEDIKKQYANKQYVANPLVNILNHVHKVLPKGPGEYQGGYLSSLENRTEKDGKISHKPNTIQYSVDKNSSEGKKLARAPLSIVLHSRINSNGKTTPIGSNELRDHSDVHVMSHLVSDSERKLSPEVKRKALEHIVRIKQLAKDHSHDHHESHEETLNRYANSTIDSGEKPNTKSYVRFLQQYHQKQIDKMKSEKGKAKKTEIMKARVNHVNDNLEKFDRTFDIHHHIQQATYAVADALSKTAHGGYKHHIDNEEAAGEGFVSGGVKLVPRKFTEANRKRSMELKAQRSAI